MVRTISTSKMKTFFLLLIALLASVILFKTDASAGTADNTYYNTGILTYNEETRATLWPKGTVIVMTPTDDKMYIGTEAENLIINGTVKTIAIPGVGSSSIGAAAFAKHIADIRNEYVAGITVGYGDASIYTEGTQGYFIGRSSNIAGTYYYEPASAKLADLYARGARPSLLVGHSKGDMDVANALYKMYNEGHQSWYQGVRVVTFGCGVYVPAGVGTFNQYLGNLDTLGTSNTVSYRNLTWVYGRYHTTNPFYWATYMPIDWYLEP
jgi:hypothetical protein